MRGAKDGAGWRNKHNEEHSPNEPKDFFVGGRDTSKNDLASSCLQLSVERGRKATRDTHTGTLAAALLFL